MILEALEPYNQVFNMPIYHRRNVLKAGYLQQRLYYNYAKITDVFTEEVKLRKLQIIAIIIKENILILNIFVM